MIKKTLKRRKKSYLWKEIQICKELILWRRIGDVDGWYFGPEKKIFISCNEERDPKRKGEMGLSKEIYMNECKWKPSDAFVSVYFTWCYVEYCEPCSPRRQLMCMEMLKVTYKKCKYWCSLKILFEHSVEPWLMDSYNFRQLIFILFLWLVSNSSKYKRIKDGSQLACKLRNERPLGRSQKKFEKF